MVESSSPFLSSSIVFLSGGKESSLQMTQVDASHPEACTELQGRNPLGGTAVIISGGGGGITLGLSEECVLLTGQRKDL